MRDWKQALAKNLVKGHLLKSFVKSVDEELNDSKRRLSLVGF